MALIEQRVSDLSGKVLDPASTARVRIERAASDKVQVLDVHTDELASFEGKGELMPRRGRKPKTA